jgi:hypothetical protein
MMVRTIPLALAFACLLGCNLPGPGTAGPSNRNLITAEDIANSSAAMAQSAYEVVQRLQPQWLTSRGNVSITDASATVASVYLNGVQVGDVEYLRNLLPSDIEQLRYFPAGEASARFGMGHQRGVIEVTLKG